MSTYTAEPDTSDQLIVTVEQADALLEMIASNEKANRISSAALTSGLAAQGLAGANGLAGDAARILEPVRTAHTRICIRTVSPPHARCRARLEDLAHSTSLSHHALRRGRRTLQPGRFLRGPPYPSLSLPAARRPYHPRRASLHSRGFRRCDSFPGCTARSGCTQQSRDIWSRKVALRPGLPLRPLERRDLRTRADTTSTMADGATLRLLRHRPHARTNPRAARRQCSRTNAVSPGAGCASTRSDLGNADGATHALDLPVVRRLAAVNTQGSTMSRIHQQIIALSLVHIRRAGLDEAVADFSGNE